jgi:3D (Asp-Asp-Asp) domain-containing protein
MWRILDLMAGVPVRGDELALPLPRERHKVGTVTAFSDDCKAKNKPKSAQSSMLASITNPPVSAALWYGHALVRGLARFRARLLVIAFCCAICGVAGAASGGATPKAGQHDSAALRRENATLGQRIHSAILELYALDSKLNRVHAQTAALADEHERIARQRQSLRMQLDASQHNLHASRRQLALLIHTLYEQQTDDPLAIVFGAESLEEAITSLDELGHAAQQHRDIAARSRAALTSLHASVRALARENARIDALEAAASRTAASLLAAEGSRRDFVSALSEQRQLNGAQISRIHATARASAATGVELTARAAATTKTDATSSAPVAVSTPAGRTVTVVATGYAMGGTTATGVPVGWGTVAVDPSVIPLGTRMTIPGYGEGVAADTGPAVQGTSVDLWFPTTQQALAWGRRVVTVTLH